MLYVILLQLLADNQTELIEKSITPSSSFLELKKLRTTGFQYQRRELDE